MNSSRVSAPREVLRQHFQYAAQPSGAFGIEECR
jgi:hypothetical protein